MSAGNGIPATGTAAAREPSSELGSGLHDRRAEELLAPATGVPAPSGFDTAGDDSADRTGPSGAPAPQPSLAEQQAALVRALVAGAAAPPGFDAADLAATAHALLHKRAGEVAARFPVFAYACGPEFTARFLEWAATRPKTTTAADAAAFAAHVGVPPPKTGGRRRFGR
ncbi:hypothetical protein ACWIGI_04710 [Nocardia sp. NPDC055321]